MSRGIISSEKKQRACQIISSTRKRKNETPDTNSSTQKPSLITFENDRGSFLQRCFFKCKNLQQFEHPAFLKKLLLSAKRFLEEKSSMQTVFHDP